MSIGLPVFTPIEETLYLTRSSSTWGPGWTPGCSASPPPDTVDWYDVDFPEVITARRQLLPKRANAHSIGTDLTNSDWLDAIPTNAIWAAKHYHGTQSVADLIRSPGFDDPHQPERWNPRLRLVEEILLTREGGRRVPDRPSPVYPPGRAQHRPVPKRNDGPALPLLALQPKCSGAGWWNSVRSTVD
jgi:hypothetical protein